LLRYVPIQIADWPSIYMDARHANTFDWLTRSPLPECPHERDEQIVIRRVVRAGDVAFDIGANIGFHTALLSHRVGGRGRVVAFEPNPSILPALRKTVAAMPNAMLLSVALSDREGESILFMAEELTEVASLANWTRGAYGRISQIVCHLRRLDDLVRSEGVPPPHFVKCDVEGAELRVFRGGAGTFDRVDAPIVLFESNVYTSRGFGVGMWDAKEFLANLPRPAYTFFEVRGGGALSADGAFNSVHSNILAVPKARLGDFADVCRV